MAAASWVVDRTVLVDRTARAMVVLGRCVGERPERKRKEMERSVRSSACAIAPVCALAGPCQPAQELLVTAIRPDGLVQLAAFDVDGRTLISAARWSMLMPGPIQVPRLASRLVGPRL